MLYIKTNKGLASDIFHISQSTKCYIVCDIEYPISQSTKCYILCGFEYPISQSARCYIIVYGLDYHFKCHIECHICKTSCLNSMRRKKPHWK